MSKKKKLKAIAFRDETYTIFLRVVWGCDEKSATKFLNRLYNMEEEPDAPEEWAGITKILKNDKGDEHFVVCLQDDNIGDPWSVSVLCHELLHVTHFALGARGIKLSNKTKEAYCYLFDSLVRRSLELINKRQEKEK